MDKVLRVLVVDDSAYVRKVIKQMLGRSPFIEVVGIARDGEEALSLAEQLRPDVVTVDLMMPGIGGLGFIREQMATRPLPIVVVSIANETSQIALDALDSGAIDFIQKPSALATDKIFEMADELIEKVKAAASVNISKLHPATAKIVDSKKKPKTTGQVGASPIDLIVIGISTGGPQSLKQLLTSFQADFRTPIAVVLHMPVGYTEPYAQRLNDVCMLAVSEAKGGEAIQPGHVFIAPGGRHLTTRRDASGGSVFHLDSSPLNTLHRPSVDVLFRSAGETFGKRVLGVIMTGMGDDGKEGAAAIKSKGGIIFAEAEESCVVFGMPRAVIEAQLADRVVPLEDMYDAILGVSNGQDSYHR